MTALLSRPRPVSELSAPELRALNASVSQALVPMPSHADRGPALYGGDRSHFIANEPFSEGEQAQEVDFTPRESAAATLLWLKAMVAPPLIMFAPRGPHCICPQGINQTILIENTEADSRMLSAQLQRMRANGTTPFFSRNHDLAQGRAGEPLDIFWRPQVGHVALVAWTPKAEQQILTREFDAFSEECVTAAADKSGLKRLRLGLEACCGTLARSSAYGKYYCRVTPVTRAKAMHDLAALFLRRVDSLSSEFKASSNTKTVVDALNQVGCNWPILRKAYELREWLRSEFAADDLARTL